MRLVVTGYRYWMNRDAVWRVLDQVLWTSSDAYHFVGVGDCPTGADLYARQYLNAKAVPHRVFYANWDWLGKRAGNVRNEYMVDSVRPDLVVAFLHRACSGTVHCRDYALAHGYEVMPIWA